MKIPATNLSPASLAALTEASAAINSSLDLDVVLDAVARSAAEVMRADASSVLTVAATDDDATAVLSGWAITAGNTDKDGDSNLPFAINSSTGQNTANYSADLDSAQTASFALSVTVSDGTNTSATQTVTVNVLD